jgi:hypothetical protein
MSNTPSVNEAQSGQRWILSELFQEQGQYRSRAPAIPVIMLTEHSWRCPGVREEDANQVSKFSTKKAPSPSFPCFFPKSAFCNPRDTKKGAGAHLSGEVPYMDEEWGQVEFWGWGRERQVCVWSGRDSGWEWDLGRFFSFFNCKIFYSHTQSVEDTEYQGATSLPHPFLSLSLSQFFLARFPDKEATRGGRYDSVFLEQTIASPS